MKPPIPSNELERLATLRSYRLLDTKAEEDFDRVVSLASEICATPIALFSLVDEDRQWFKSKVGLDAEQTPKDVSFCAHAVAADEELLVNDTREEPRFMDNALVLGAPFIRFYYGVPVHAREGQPLGTLCVIDREPRTLTDTQRAALGQLSREIELRLELRRTNLELTQALEDRTVMSAMIAHDARNLMTRVIGELECLPDEASRAQLAAIERANAAATQLLRMCENFVEINRGHERPDMVACPVACDLDAWIRALAAREAHRARNAGVALSCTTKLQRPRRNADTALLERVLLNLLDNAYREAPPGSTVELALLENEAGEIQLVVEDRGRGVADVDRDRLFEPYFRAAKSEKPGSGLGLAFCRLAASALGGTIEHEAPSSGGARFRVTLPAA